MSRREIALAIAVLLGVAVWSVWPKPMKQPTHAPSVADQRAMAEAVLMEFLPDSYLDTMAASQSKRGFADTDTAAIWLPGSNPAAPGVHPFWTGTVGELRNLLIARRQRNNSAIPPPSTATAGGYSGMVVVPSAEESP